MARDSKLWTGCSGATKAEPFTNAGADTNDFLALTTTREEATNPFLIAGKKANAKTAVKVAGARAKKCIVPYPRGVNLPQERRAQPGL